jgi:hypothetical protein
VKPSGVGLPGNAPTTADRQIVFADDPAIAGCCEPRVRRKLCPRPSAGSENWRQALENAQNGPGNGEPKSEAQPASRELAYHGDPPTRFADDLAIADRCDLQVSRQLCPPSVGRLGKLAASA